MAPPPHALAAAATSALGVAVGVRLLLVLSRSRALKPLAAATSAAAAALKTPRVLAAASSPLAAGFLGLQVHKGIRNGVDALGVVVKVAVIASEVAVWVGGRCWGGRRGRSVRFLCSTRPSGLLLVRYSKSEAQVVLFDHGLGIAAMDGDEKQMEEQEGSDLLCLAVPVPEATNY
uniref:Uncharacterized protein n=3 Tax=Oryza TaxID=4527 RepID=A0A0D3FDL3_9ORYZ